MKQFSLIKQFNWRILLIRILVNALVLLLVVVVLPSIKFVNPSLLSWLLLALVLGLLNAIVKPLVQFLTLPFIFATYGIIIILINAFILLLLSWLLPGAFQVTSLLGALLGGAIIGIASSFLESLLGVTPPIVSDSDEQLQKQF